MTQGIGYGCTLAYSFSSGSGTLGLVDGFEDEAETEMVDVTLQSDPIKKFKPADTDLGELTFEVALTSSGDVTALKLARDNGSLITFTATYSNGGSDTITGYVKSIGRTVKKREMLTSKITVKETA